MAAGEMWAILRRLAAGDKSVTIAEGGMAVSMNAARQALGGYPTRPPITPAQLVAEQRVAVSRAMGSFVF